MWIPTAAIEEISATPVDGWVSDNANTWTFASSSTFTVVGDRTQVFSKGTRLKFTQTTEKFAVVIGASHAAGTTTITIAVNNDYTLADAPITNNYFSYVFNPLGYPDWFSYTPTVTGFSSAPTVNVRRFRIDGKMCTVEFDNFNTDGTSNLTTFTVSLPAAAARNQMPYPIQFADNSSGGTSPGLARTASGSSTLSLFVNFNAGTWTASGSKWARFVLSYEF